MIAFNTPPKFNIEPENQPLEKEWKGYSYWKPSFSGSMLNFGGVWISFSRAVRKFHVKLHLNFAG